MYVAQSAPTPNTFGPCAVCKEPSSHRVSDFALCCKCYVWNGGPPADWHPDCLAADDAYKDIPRAKQL